MTTIGIVDYDRGNLFSVIRAINHLGFASEIIHDPDQIKNVDKLVLPGVGAFGDAMNNLNEIGMSDAIIEFAESGKLLLGVCLGMQLLLDESNEFGTHSGLGLISGKVVRLPEKKANKRLKVPNVGWAKLEKPPSQTWHKTILGTIQEGSYAYFVHSYHSVPVHEEAMLAVQLYGNTVTAAVIQRENVTGCQFHPEQSAEVGLCILEAWLTQ